MGNWGRCIRCMARQVYPQVGSCTVFCPRVVSVRVLLRLSWFWIWSVVAWSAVEVYGESAGCMRHSSQFSCVSWWAWSSVLECLIFVWVDLDLECCGMKRSCSLWWECWLHEAQFAILMRSWWAWSSVLECLVCCMSLESVLCLEVHVSSAFSGVSSWCVWCDRDLCAGVCGICSIKLASKRVGLEFMFRLHSQEFIMRTMQFTMR